MAACGAIGKAAEKVPAKHYQDMKAYMQDGAPVDEHLADQLLLPLAICAGGRFRTGLQPQVTSMSYRGFSAMILGKRDR